MMAETQPDSISVEALARRAGVTRQTFYAHYTCIGAMLEEHLQGLLTEIAARHRRAFSDADDAVAPERLRELMTSVFADLDADDPRLAALLDGPVASEVEARFADLVTQFLTDADAAGSEALTPRENAAQARFFAGGFLSLLRHWLALGSERPPPEVMGGMLADFCLYGRKGRCPSLQLTEPTS
ncbi:TetR/AcrR family transcriptional regulator [Roseivivax jejudonensis]|nr:TetR/AcrR family transcriptional regulator [Roseivivax jejudonensis]